MIRENPAVTESCESNAVDIETNDITVNTTEPEINNVTEQLCNEEIDGNEKAGMTGEKETTLEKEVDCLMFEQPSTSGLSFEQPSTSGLSFEQPSTSGLSFEQASASSVISPKKILPSPKVTPTLKQRRNRCQKSEILTSSPFKAMVEQRKAENELKKKPKLDLKQDIKGKENKCSQKKLKSVSKGKGKGIGKGKGKQKSTKITDEANNKNETGEEDAFCLLCGEKYEHPPIEDWVQCPSCCGWAHEMCTDAEDGCFLCVNCQT